MIYKIFFFICLNGIIGMYAQSSNEKTIYCNDTYTVVFVFDSPIVSAEPGSTEYYFGFNEKNPSKIGKLQGFKDSKETNLFVITQNGKMYSFILKYKKDIPFIDLVKRIGDSEAINANENELNENVSVEQQLVIDSVENTENEKKESIITNYDYDKRLVLEKNNKTDLEIVCEKIYASTTNYYRREFEVTDRVLFRLKNYYYQKEQLYFYLEIENNSEIDFDINFVRFFTTTANKNKREIAQKIVLGNNGEPAFKYKVPNRIKANSKERFICVYDKFSINKNKSILINISELKGERILALEFYSKFINKPNTL